MRHIPFPLGFSPFSCSILRFQLHLAVKEAPLQSISNSILSNPHSNSNENGNEMTTTSKKDTYGATDVSLHNSTKWPQTNGGSPTKSDGDNNTTGVMGFPGKRFCPDGICDEKDAKKFSHYHHYSNGKHKHNHPINPRVYFTEFTARKAFLYGIASVYVIGCGLASVAAVFLDLPCPTTAATTIEFPNPAYDGSRCPHVRHAILLGLTTTECSFGRRLVMSILMGGLIGWERRQADRPAGIRTMSLVSLGSCLFTINSTFAFLNGPMAWDASRISAAIPSGVGFLGAGLIFKKTNDDDNMVVHGLTTAASVWLSAAVSFVFGFFLFDLFCRANLLLRLCFCDWYRCDSVRASPHRPSAVRIFGGWWVGACSMGASAHDVYRL